MRIFRLTLLLMLLFTAFQASQSQVYADMPCCVDACPDPDPADPYSCEGGSWCCSGNGCPSQVCEDAGCDFNESLWQCCLIDTFDEDTIPSIGSEAECDAISGSYPGGCSWRPNSTCRCTNCQDAACGDIDLSGDSCFNCDESPGCVPAVCEDSPLDFGLLSPADGAQLGSTVVPLDWEDPNWGPNCSGDSFEVTVLNQNGTLFCTSGLIGSGNSAYTLNGTGSCPALSSGTTYQWFVTAYNEFGDRDSPTWSFSITSLNTPPTGTASGPAVLHQGQTGQYSTTLNSNNVGQNMSGINLVYRRYDPTLTTYSWGGWYPGSVWTTFASAACSSASCTITNANFLPPTHGNYWVAATGSDAGAPSAACSGNPEFIGLPPGSTISGFYDCGSGSRITINMPADATSLSGPSSIPPGGTAFYSATAVDYSDGMDSMRINTRKYNPPPPLGTGTPPWGSWIFGENWTTIATNTACSGTSCTIGSAQFTPPSPGYYWVVAGNVLDNAGSGCGGNPQFIGLPAHSTIAGLYDCGADSRISVGNSCTVTAPVVDDDQPTPSDDTTDVQNSSGVVLAWGSDTTWGNSCIAPQTNSFRAYWAPKSDNNMATDCQAPANGDYNIAPTGYNEGCSGTVNTFCNVPTMTLPGQAYCWYIVADNGAATDNSASSVAANIWKFKTEDPLADKNWLTSIGASIYTSQVTMELPLASEYVAAFTPPHLAYIAATDPEPVGTFANGGINLIAQSGYTPESQSQLWVKNIGASAVWPLTYAGIAPSTATPINESSCNTVFSTQLSVGGVYKGPSGCINTGITARAGTGQYVLQSSNGIAVLYVTDGGTININNNFVSNNANKRLLIVTSGTVQITDTIGVATPALTSTPNVGVGIIAAGSGSVSFLGTLDPTADPDSTLVIEGPIITKNLLPARNRGSGAAGNGYPSEIIRYNPLYLYRLTEAERTAALPNQTGLFVYDVDWLPEE